ncbi:MAG: acylglycerol kinase family protein [Marinilabiliales bacterium]|nr:acylglycerol kinase family protein [Marinilabiliales bacterium]
MEVRSSEYAGHAFQIGRDAAMNGTRRIISVGGDGTPFEIVNGLYAEGRPRQAIELGMIPSGTGNSFPRDFSTLSWRRAVENIAGREKPQGGPGRDPLSQGQSRGQAVLPEYPGRRPDRRHPEADQREIEGLRFSGLQPGRAHAPWPGA